MSGRLAVRGAAAVTRLTTPGTGIVNRHPLPLEIDSLGGLEVRVGGRRLPSAALPMDGAGALLARLLVVAAPAGADEIARDLWPLVPDRSARLGEAVGALRQALHPAEPCGLWRVALTERGPCRLMMGIEDRWDLADLRRRLAALRGAPPEIAPLIAERAEILCRGPLLPELPALPWLAAARAEAEDLQRAALEEVAGLLEGRGERRAAEGRRRRLAEMCGRSMTTRLQFPERRDLTVGER